MKKHGKRILSLLVVVAVLLAAIPWGAAALAAEPETGQLKVASLSDTHYYPQTLQPAEGDPGYGDWREFCVKKSKQFTESEGLIDNALAALKRDAAAGKLDVVVVSGDLTKDGELEAHRELAKKFAAFEQETGKPVFVINGNHDINNPDACSWASGKEVQSEGLRTSPEQFREIYRDFGYDGTGLTDYEAYTPPAGEKAGMLSYAVTLPNGYRLIAMDGGKYSGDATEDGKNLCEVGGNYSDGLMKWILKQCRRASEQGQTVLGLTHFNLAAHFQYEPRVLQDFTIDRWEQVSEQLADAGMNFAFTGHMHSNDIAKHVSDQGNVLIDCETNSLLSFPNTFRETVFDNTSSPVSAAFHTYSVDRDEPVLVHGKDPAQGKSSYSAYSFNLSFGPGFDGQGIPRDADAAAFLEIMLHGMVGGYLEQMQGENGIQNFLKGMGIDLEEVLKGVVGEGLKVGPVTITASLINGVVRDLLDQIQARYVDDPEHLYQLLDRVVEKLASIPMSKLPNAKFVASANPLKLNYGSAEEPGTLGDVVLNCLYYMYRGNEDLSDDPFTRDVIRQLQEGDTAQRMVDAILDILLNDLLNGELLPSLTLHTTQLAQDNPDMKFAISIVEMLTGKNPTLKKVVQSVLGTGLFGEATSLNGLVQNLMDSYFTSSQMESIGSVLAGAVKDLCTDTNPMDAPNQDAVINDPQGVTYTNARETVTPTAAEYRLPSDLAVTFGEKTGTRNIQWYTKSTVEGTDIQIVPYTDSPQFTDGLPKGVRVSVDQDLTGLKTVTYPGIDFGVIGILHCQRELYRHAVVVSGLEAGQKYCYRVGDRDRGWWSPAGVLEAADGSDGFTFLHMSDSQAQNESQYEVWGNVVNTALRQYPQSKFIMHTGDFVDQGSNADQWHWGFNAGNQALRNTVLMPTAGNHEAKGENALTDHFFLSGLPEQDTTLGAYYSFDYNNAHFMVLNTNNLSSENTLSEDQLRWLKADASASRAKWKIVALHKAPYSNGSHYSDGDVEGLRGQLSVLMPQLGIDLVLEGHDHVYLRTKPLKDGKPAAAGTAVKAGYEASVDPQGTIYVISACAGVKSYPPKEGLLEEETAKAVKTEDPVFSAIRIQGDSLYFDAVRVAGEKTEKIDSFALVKDGSAVLPPDENPDSGQTQKPEPTVPAETKPIPDTSDGAVWAVAVFACAGGAYVFLRKRREAVR